jgi:hypothetical protein
MNSPVTTNLQNGGLEYADPDRQAEIVASVVKMLDGLPLSQALHIAMNSVPMVLTSTHVVDVKNDRYCQFTRA